MTVFLATCNEGRHSLARWIGLFLALFVGTAAVLPGCSNDRADVTIRIGSYTVSAEVADTPEARRRGLMQRESLPPNRGMLFVFPDEEPRSFWMRNTSIPLSIIYIDADGVIVSIHRMTPYSEESVPSWGAAKYALEVNQGEPAANGVRAGDRVTLPAGLSAESRRR